MRPSDGRVAAAKSFGLVSYGQGKVELTPLGIRACDPKQEKSAKTEAFLAVALYKALYEKFRSCTLPPPSGLEAEMAALGVSKKQTERVRQVFQRSALQSGFFWSGKDRLVMPPTEKPEQGASSGDGTEDPKSQKNRNGGDDGDGGYHPFIEGLIKTLPQPSQDWPMQKRVKWLEAASSVFELIYEDKAQDGFIQIKIQKDPE